VTTATATPSATPNRRIWLVAGAITLVVAILIVLANLAVYWLRGEAIKAGLSTDTRPVHVELATKNLEVPANMIRFSDQRRKGPHDRLDLVVQWPTMSGYSERTAGAFDDVSPDAPLLFLSVRPRGDSVDSTTRLIGLYTRFFDGSGGPGPAGLVSRRLQPGSGYDSEEIFFEPGSTDPFSARCAKNTNDVIPTTCLRDINIGEDLTVSSRFRKPLLADWRRLDPAIRMLIDKMRRKG